MKEKFKYKFALIQHNFLCLAVFGPCLVIVAKFCVQLAINSSFSLHLLQVFVSSFPFALLFLFVDFWNRVNSFVSQISEETMNLTLPFRNMLVSMI